MAKIKRNRTIKEKLSSEDEYLEYAWMELGDVTKLDLRNPFTKPEWEDPSLIPELIVETCRNPDYLHFFIKYILNIEQIFPYQMAIIQELWHKPFPMIIATRGGSKSFLLSIYIILRAVLHQGCKIVVVGASLRQALVLYNYISSIWDNAPILRDICGGDKNSPKSSPIQSFWICGNSKVSFLPLGDGTTIRGQRATHIVCDETASIDPNIFDTVIAGFAATKSDGVAQHVIKKFKEKELKKLGIIKTDNASEELGIESSIATILKSNQIIMAGTAYYHFNHFYKRYCDYREIILSGGKLSDKHDAQRRNATINSEDYSIIQLPYDKILYMMDENVINQAKMTMDPGIFQMEYGAVFSKDSEGFFLASVLESNTSPPGNEFGPRLTGDYNYEYVMGIDPASEEDRFSINIMELHADHRRVVYQWSTNRKDFEKLRDQKALPEDINDYNTFFIRHIRDLLHRFNIKYICMDTGGGGISIRELLKDKDKCRPGDSLIIDMDDENNNLPGLRILKMIEFASYDWRCQAHYGLRTDLLNKKVLFPAYDAAAAEADAYHSDQSGRKVDRLDDCYYEILELKTETTLIKHTATPSTNKEVWDVPQVIGLDPNNKKKKLKRDRFTSMLLSNWAARLYLDDGGVIVPKGNDYRGIAKKTEVGENTRIFQPYYGKGFNAMKHASDIYTNSAPAIIQSDNRSIFY